MKLKQSIFTAPGREKNRNTAKISLHFEKKVWNVYSR